MNTIIQPRVLKGFRDFLPDAETARKSIIGTLENGFRLHGFAPIDTPMLEYTEVLLGKGGGETDKQIYRFEDNGGRDVALRFDLTVPFARYMAAHRAELYLPFKRYHIAKVFRGENTQRGRYREFMQCDFDIVGTDCASADFEILLLIVRSLESLQVPAIDIHIAHRGIFNRLLDRLNIQEHSAEVLRRVDKLKKIGRNQTHALLVELMPAEAADEIMSYIHAEGGNAAVLETITALAGGPDENTERLSQVLRFAEDLGIQDSVVLDPSITRGLDYYTGIVYESFLRDLPEIGSVCSGGRYNDLASIYTKEHIPGVGASIGLDRLIAGLEELGALKNTSAAPDVIIVCQDDSLLGHYHMLADSFRKHGVSAEVYPESRKIPAQFAFAEKKGSPYVAICGPAEYEAGVLNLRRISDRTNFDGLTMEAACKIVHPGSTPAAPIKDHA